MTEKFPTSLASTICFRKKEFVIRIEFLSFFAASLLGEYKKRDILRGFPSRKRDGDYNNEEKKRATNFSALKMRTEKRSCVKKLGLEREKKVWNYFPVEL